MFLVNLATSDLKTAQQARSELVSDTDETFAAIRSGTYKKAVKAAAELDPKQLGRRYREALREPDAAGDKEQVWLIQNLASDEADAYRSSASRDAFTEGWTGAEGIPDRLDAYIGGAGLAPRTEAERRRQVQRFAEWCNERQGRVTPGKVTRGMAGDYVSEVLDGMHRATQQKHLTGLRQYWLYLAQRGVIEPPQGVDERSGWPWNGQQRAEPRGRRVTRGSSRTAEERAFNADEVKTLLSAIPAGRMNADHMQQCRDVLRISLLTGMRLAEIVTLWAEDVESDDSGLWIDIKEGKTEAAARRVPVHSDLTALIERLVKGKDKGDWLFSDLRIERDPSDVFSKRFARFRKRLGVDESIEGVRRSLVNFHSARRWFITLARHAGQPKETIQEIVGHAADKDDVTFGVYTKGSSGGQLRACVEAVKLPAGAMTDKL